MRPAASAWEKHYTEMIDSVGVRRAKAAPTVFCNPETEVRCVVHGDDFMFLGYSDELKKIADTMREWYELKVRGVLDGEPGGRPGNHHPESQA